MQLATDPCAASSTNRDVTEGDEGGPAMGIDRLLDLQTIVAANQTDSGLGLSGMDPLFDLPPFDFDPVLGKAAFLSPIAAISTISDESGLGREQSPQIDGNTAIVDAAIDALEKPLESELAQIAAAGEDGLARHGGLPARQPLPPKKRGRPRSTRRPMQTTKNSPNLYSAIKQMTDQQQSPNAAMVSTQQGSPLVLPASMSTSELFGSHDTLGDGHLEASRESEYSWMAQPMSKRRRAAYSSTTCGPRVHSLAHGQAGVGSYGANGGQGSGAIPSPLLSNPELMIQLGQRPDAAVAAAIQAASASASAGSVSPFPQVSSPAALSPKIPLQHLRRPEHRRSHSLSHPSPATASAAAEDTEPKSDMLGSCERRQAVIDDLFRQLVVPPSSPPDGISSLPPGDCLIDRPESYTLPDI